MRLAPVVLLGACSFHGPDLAVDAAAGPCGGPACRRATITIHHDQVVGGPLAQFPLLVAIDDLTLGSAAAPTGFDIAFTDADGARLSYERETYEAGNLVACVALPMLRGDADTTIYMSYGDLAATIDHQDPAHVWDDHFGGVWHLAQTTGGADAILDSTSNGSHATDEAGVAIGSPGRFGSGVAFDGVDDRLHVDKHAALDAATTTGTLELWVQWVHAARTGLNQRLLMMANTFAGDFTGMEWATTGTGDYYYYPARAGSMSNPDGVAAPFTDGVWHHVAIAQDFPTKSIAFYLDGMPLAPSQNGAPGTWIMVASPADWYWGGAPTRNAFMGSMDEIRVSTIVRSPGWIASEYANQHAPTTFLSIEF